MIACVEQINREFDWSALTRWAGDVVEEAVTIQQIPAPTFAEQARAAYVAGVFSACRLAEVSIDAQFNVYGLLAGRTRGCPGVLVSAHTDTIFPAEVDLSVRREGTTIHAPGLGDNSIGVAGLVGLARILAALDYTPEVDIWFVATSREEGLGDLGGMRAAFARLAGQIGAVVNLEGLAFGHVYHAGIAVRRLKVSAHTPGGHSWLHFGRTNAIHVLMELGTRLTAVRPAQSPRTTYNIGIIEGGQAVNAIATDAAFWLDLRSEDPAALEALEAQMRARIAATRAPDLTLRVELVGDRPAGRLAPDHALVRGALAALAHVGQHGTLEMGSTDANVPLARGVPAVTIGITRGGNAHRLDEFIETAPVAAGMRHLITLVLAAARDQGAQPDC